MAPSSRIPVSDRRTADSDTGRLEQLQHDLALSDGELSALLGVSEKTLRRRKGDGNFGRGEALQLELLERALNLAQETLADEATARAWLKTPIPSLGNQTPLSLLTTLRGYDRVRDVLYRQVEGMF